MLQNQTIKKFSVIVSLIIGYLYISTFSSLDGNWTIWFIGFASIFSAWVIIINNKKVKESFIWFIAMWLNILACTSQAYEQSLGLNLGTIWLSEQGIFPFVLMHCYAIYWVMSISDGLLETKSSKYFVKDCINGAIIIPFSNLFLLFRDITKLKQKREDEKKNYQQVVYIVLAIIIALTLFVSSISLLSTVNEQFGNLFSGFLTIFDVSKFDLLHFETIILKMIMSIPVSSYLYGLIVGVHNYRENKKENDKKRIDQAMLQLKKIPSLLWNVVLALFACVYLIFFIVQFKYLFGIMLTGSAISGYSISEYARSGFFELCKVMAINFVLIWLVKKSNTDERVNTNLCGLIMFESILLSITAFSKIYYYIQVFGFTPLRYQSIWFTTVIMTGCVCVLYYLYTKKDSSRYWILFTGITLAITIII